MTDSTTADLFPEESSEEDKEYANFFAIRAEEVSNNYKMLVENHLTELLKEHQGEYALMKNGGIVRIYTEVADALMDANKFYADHVFSVHKITRKKADYGRFSRY